MSENADGTPAEEAHDAPYRPQHRDTSHSIQHTVWRFIKALFRRY